jgi:hypothetical protein
MGQLSRYFQATKARIGILTNGRLFQFFSDLDDRNLMDQKPFAEIDLFDLRSAPIEQIKQMSKTMFDIDNLLSSAERLKYLRGVKEEIKAELSDPSDWFVREMAVRVHSAQRITGQLQEKFKPIVIDAIKAYINDRINERLSTAMEVEKSAAEVPVVEQAAEEESSGTVYTEEEKEGLYIVRAICAAEVDPMRLTERDTKAYCGIILDGNSRKYFMRMYFNATIKKIEIFDNAEPAVVHLESISDLYKHVDRIKNALRLKLS